MTIPCPVYKLKSVPDAATIEGGWKWSGKQPIPAIGQSVEINFNELGGGQVTGYFVEANYLGIYVKLDPKRRPAWHKKQNPKQDYAMVFGVEIDQRS